MASNMRGTGLDSSSRGTIAIIALSRNETSLTKKNKSRGPVFQELEFNFKLLWTRLCRTADGRFHLSRDDLFHFCSLSEQVILMTASSRNNASLVFIQR
jgi:hypothetical protein